MTWAQTAVIAVVILLSASGLGWVLHNDLERVRRSLPDSPTQISAVNCRADPHDYIPGVTQSSETVGSALSLDISCELR